VDDEDFELALVDLDAEIARYGDATELESQRKAATALLRKSGILGRLGRFDEAVAVLDELAARYGGRCGR
jgi:TolA-binding protein